MLVFLRSAGKLFQACGAASEIRLFPYVDVEINMLHVEIKVSPRLLAS